MELENENSKMTELQAEFDRIATWSEIFDSSDTATQKMICGYIIKRVRVYRDYQLSVEFNNNIEQFLNGIDSVEQTDSFQQVLAQLLNNKLFQLGHTSQSKFWPLNKNAKRSLAHLG